MMTWIFNDPRCTPDTLGFIPAFFSEEDPRPAKEQINDAYISGWQPMEGFHMDVATKALTYPGDPEMPPLAESMLRDERIYVYECAWVVIMQPDNSWEAARID